MLALAQALTVPKPRHPEVVHGSVDGVCSKVQTVNALWGVADGAHQLSQPLAGPLDLQVTQVAAAQGTASASPGAGNPTLRVTPQPSWTRTPVGTFSTADYEQLLGCRTSELRESALQRTTGSP